MKARWRDWLASFRQPARSLRAGTRYYRLRLEILESRLAPSAHDILSTAIPYPSYGTSVPGQIVVVNLVELYSVQLNAGDEIQADAAPQNLSHLAAALRIFDSSGKQLAFQENTSGGTDTMQTFDAIASGTYYVGVSSNGNYSYDPKTADSGSGGLTTGSYTLTLTLGSILLTEHPGNTTIGTAQPVTGIARPVDVIGTGSITGTVVLAGTYVNGQTEYYTFFADQSGSLTVTVTPADGGVFLPRLTLYSDKGDLLIQADGVNAFNAAVQLNQNLQLGPYYLGVSAVSDSGTAADSQDYVLATTFTPALPPFQPLDVGGTVPEGVAVGDFNHDGNLDLVTANYDSSNKADNYISILLGNGDGSFQPAYNGSVMNGSAGVGPSAVTVADLNHDGNLDIVTANGTDSTVSILLGKGDGTFQNPITYKVGNDPIAVAVGDLNGQPDIVTANANYNSATSSYGPGTVSVLLGDGSGTFAQPAVAYNVGFKPFDIAVGDFNGHPDIVTANAGDSAVSLLLGDGAGNFPQPALTLSTKDSAGKGTVPYGVAVGNLNGRPDIVTADEGDGRVSVLLGEGGGAFQPAVTYPVQGNPYSVVIGDFNGRPDIAVANHFSNSVSMLLGNGDGTFQPANSYSVGYHPSEMAAGDFNHDGNLDLAVTDALDNKVSLLSGNGAGAFAVPPSLAIGQRPFAVAQGDFNHDGNVDLVTANDGTNTVSVLLGNGGGTFQPQVTYAVGANPDALAVGDLNNDGSPDIVIANAGDDTVSVLLGLGNGTFLLPARSYKIGKPLTGIAIGAFMDNGILDIVTANSTDNTVSVLLGKGDGTFTPDPYSSPGLSPGTFSTEDSFGKGTDPKSVAIGDFNGHLGIVTANAGDNTVSVLLGNGDGSFLPAVTKAVGEDPESVTVANFNGRSDIVTANFGYNSVTKKDDPGTVSVLLGQGGSVFLPAVSYDVGSRPLAVAVGDFTNDHHLDIAMANYGDNTVSVLLGKGDGTFQPATVVPVGDSPHGVAVADFNNDGIADIVTANLGTGTVSLLLGTGLGPFATAANYPLGSRPDAVAVAYDNNTNDIVATADGQNNTVSVLVGNPDGTVFDPAFSLSTTDENGKGIDPVAVTESSDNNGNVVIVTANADSTVSVLVAKNPVLASNSPDEFAQAFTRPTVDALGRGAGPIAVAVGNDINGNVVIVTANADKTVSVFTDNAGNDAFLSEITYSTQDTAEPTGVALATDNNNALVIVIANADNMVSVLVGNQDGTASFPTSAIIRSTEDTAGKGTGPIAVGVSTDSNSNVVIVTANSDKTVSVLRDDKGDDSFLNPVATYAVGGDPTAVAVGTDANNNLDIVTANTDENNVSVLLGNADGTSFLAAVTYDVGHRPVGVALANDTSNGGGNLDIITANAGDNTASVLLGNTQFHALTPGNSIAVRNIPSFQDLTGARDSNGAPINDELVLDSAGEILFRQGLGGPGQFAPPVTINTGIGANVFRASDFTVFQTPGGWAVAAIDVAGNTVSIYTWDSATPQHPFQRRLGFATGNGPVRIASHDLNGDGLDDLVVANNFDHSLTIAFQSPAGAFDTVVRQAVGAAPSDIAFANLGGDGPDIVVSDQASGDFTVLHNDPAHLFGQESRYRAGAGLFDINLNKSSGEQTISSQLQTVAIAAGSFTGSSTDDLIVLNRGAMSFALFANRGQGSFADSNPAKLFPTSAQPSQIVPLTLTGDTLPSVAILMEDVGQIWIYRNLGNGVFDQPLKINAGNHPTGFCATTLAGNLALLVGNAFGDILTLLDDGNGSFIPDRADLRSAPLAIGTIPGTGQQFAIVANQNSDAVSLYYRIAGTNSFSTPIALTGTTALPLLAPGAIQTFTVPGDPNPYLVVANSLSNGVLLYHFDSAAGKFALLRSIEVGDDPVSITVGDINGDNIPDLLVANRGSNDISVLIGSTATGTWTSTAYQRLGANHSGPLAVALKNTGGPNGPSLLVTTRDGHVVEMPGIGLGGVGSGFFRDINPPTGNLGNTIGGAILDPNGRLLLRSIDGRISVQNGDGFSTLINSGVATLDAAGSYLVAGFTDGSIGLLASDGTQLLSQATGFTDSPSALQVLQNGNQFDVFATQQGSDVPIIVSFAIPVITDLATTSVAVQATNLPGVELVLIATLTSGELVEFLPASAASALPRVDVFTVFLPNPDNGKPPDEFIVVVTQVPGEAPEVSIWRSFPSGVNEGLEQHIERQRLSNRLEEVLNTLREFLQQLGTVVQPPASSISIGALPSPITPSAGGEPSIANPSEDSERHATADCTDAGETVPPLTLATPVDWKAGVLAILAGAVLNVPPLNAPRRFATPDGGTCAKEREKATFPK